MHSYLELIALKDAILCGYYRNLHAKFYISFFYRHLYRCRLINDIYDPRVPAIYIIIYYLLLFFVKKERTNFFYCNKNFFLDFHLNEILNIWEF